MDLTVKLHEPMLPVEPTIRHVKVVGPLQSLLLPSGYVDPASSVTNVSNGDVLQVDPVTVTVVPVGPRYVENVSEGPPVIVKRADAEGPPTFAS
jgi:hypothetical protein